jgi:hypothetical protein
MPSVSSVEIPISRCEGSELEIQIFEINLRLLEEVDTRAYRVPTTQIMGASRCRSLRDAGRLKRRFESEEHCMA